MQIRGSIAVEHRSTRPLARLARQEVDGGRHLVGLSDAVHRRLLANAVAALASEHRRRHRRVDKAGSDGGDADSARPNACASEPVRSSAPLLAPYAGASGSPRSAPREETKTMAPPSRDFMCVAAACASSAGAAEVIRSSRSSSTPFFGRGRLEQRLLINPVICDAHVQAASELRNGVGDEFCGRAALAEVGLRRAVLSPGLGCSGRRLRLLGRRVEVDADGIAARGDFWAQARPMPRAAPVISTLFVGIGVRRRRRSSDASRGDRRQRPWSRTRPSCPS